MKTIFSIELTERTTRKYNYTIEVKYNDRFSCLKLFVTKGKINDWTIIESSIEDIKKELNNMIERGYFKRTMHFVYKF